MTGCGCGEGQDLLGLEEKDAWMRERGVRGTMGGRGQRSRDSKERDSTGRGLEGNGKGTRHGWRCV